MRHFTKSFRAFLATIAFSTILTLHTILIVMHQQKDISELDGTIDAKHGRSSPHLQSLHCEKYNGPYDKNSTSEMVYWWKIPQDESFVNSFQSMHAKEDKEKYFIFEPDLAGFNNVR